MRRPGGRRHRHRDRRCGIYQVSPTATSPDGSGPLYRVQPTRSRHVPHVRLVASSPRESTAESKDCANEVDFLQSSCSTNVTVKETLDFFPNVRSYGARSHSVPFDASVRRHRRVPQPGAQATNREHPQAGSSQTAKDDGGKPGVRFLARSKRGTRSIPAWLIVGTRQRRRRFCASGWEENKEGAAVCWRSPKDGNWL